jgi:hypothetical protein
MRGSDKASLGIAVLCGLVGTGCALDAARRTDESERLAASEARAREESDRVRLEAEASRERRSQEREEPKPASDAVKPATTATSPASTRCDETRAARVAEAKQAASELAQWGKENVARVKYFDAHCRLFDSRGVKVTRERVHDGVIVRSEPVGREDDIKCDGAPGRPAGLDADWYWGARERIDSAERGVRLVYGLSADCAELDKATLGTNLNVEWSDREGRARVLALP